MALARNELRWTFTVWNIQLSSLPDRTVTRQTTLSQLREARWAAYVLSFPPEKRDARRMFKEDREAKRYKC
jgi:hypothetical protein